MTYDLLIGDKSYSSWSLRAWLLFEHFDLAVREHRTEFYQPGFQEDLKAWFPARTVPVVRGPNGALWTDSLAIAEGLAEAHPELALWPADPVQRALARSISAEMHAGFSALRGDCPMNMRLQWQGFPASPAVRADLERITTLWEHAQNTSGSSGWLLGTYSIADAFYAPVAARIAGYDLPVSARAKAYVTHHLADPAFRRWRAMGEARNRTLAEYDMPYAQGPWPGPAPIRAVAVNSGPSENARCPYSDLPVTHFLRMEGRTFGFCNAFCRDKTLADPAAWPTFMKVYET